MKIINELEGTGYWKFLHAEVVLLVLKIWCLKIIYLFSIVEINQEENTCTVTDNQNCKYRFSFKTIGKEIEIKVLQHPFCDSGPASVLSRLFW